MLVPLCVLDLINKAYYTMHKTLITAAHQSSGGHWRAIAVVGLRGRSPCSRRLIASSSPRRQSAPGKLFVTGMAMWACESLLWTEHHAGICALGLKARPYAGKVCASGRRCR